MSKKLKIVNYKRFIASLFIVIAIILVAFYINISASETKATNANEKIIYYVNFGDTLWDIALEYKGNVDIRTYIYQLKKLNDLKTSDISPGLKLIIP